MSDYRESSNRAKAVRRGVVEPRPVAGKKTQAKAIVVEWRWPDSPFKSFRKWSKRGAYATAEVAIRALDNFKRKHPRWEFRIKPPQGASK